MGYYTEECSGKLHNHSSITMPSLKISEEMWVGMLPQRRKPEWSGHGGAGRSRGSSDCQAGASSRSSDPLVVKNCLFVNLLYWVSIELSGCIYLLFLIGTVWAWIIYPMPDTIGCELGPLGWIHAGKGPWGPLSPHVKN